MELTIVGCSGSVSGPESAASCYLVQAPHQGQVFSLLLDIGPGAFGALYRYLDPSRLDGVGLSHLHPDHCLDLCALYVAGAYSSSAPWGRIPVFGPTGTTARLARAYEAPTGTGSEDRPAIVDHFDYRDWRPEQRIGPFLVRTARVSHPVETYAIRLTETGPGGGSLTFSGDTGLSDALVELAEGSDLLLAEASHLDGPDNPRDLHMTGRQAAETATRAGVGALVLTHIPPWHDPDRVHREARPHFAGMLTLAAPGARWTIGSSGAPDG